MQIIKSIIEKFKVKELFGILFISCLFITVIPSSLAKSLGISDLRNQYQSFITLCIVVIGAYYIYHTICYITIYLKKRLNFQQRKALNYLKNEMTIDERNLLIKTFYDYDKHVFKLSGTIELCDGVITPLQKNRIIYQASSLGTIYGFSYNLYPYIYRILNENIKKKNINITRSKILWKLE